MSYSRNGGSSQIFKQSGVTANFLAPMTKLTYLGSITYEVIFANASPVPAGTFSVQVAEGSKDQNPATLTWTPLVLSAVPAVDSTNGSHQITLNQVPFQYVQLVYTANASSSADITINASTKQA
jgi:hypothetical protein